LCMKISFRRSMSLFTLSLHSLSRLVPFSFLSLEQCFSDLMAT
jgi:hypothetical protein